MERVAREVKPETVELAALATRMRLAVMGAQVASAKSAEQAAKVVILLAMAKQVEPVALVGQESTLVAMVVQEGIQLAWPGLVEMVAMAAMGAAPLVLGEPVDLEPVAMERTGATAMTALIQYLPPTEPMVLQVQPALTPISTLA